MILIYYLLLALGSWYTTIGCFILLLNVPLFMCISRLSPIFGGVCVFIFKFVEYLVLMQWLGVSTCLYGGVGLVWLIVVLGLCAGWVGCYYFFFVLLLKFCCGVLNWDFKSLVAVFMTVCEFAKVYGYFWVAIPWGNSGYALCSMPILFQIASLVGVYGVVFVVVFISSCFCFNGLNFRNVGLVFLWIGVGFCILRYHWRVSDIADVNVCQSNVGCSIVNNNRLEPLSRYIVLNVIGSSDQAEIMVWPENAFLGSVSQKAENYIKTSGKGVVLARVVSVDDGDYVRVYNSMFIYENSEKSRIDKEKLLPFAEYLPWPLSKSDIKLFDVGTGSKMWRGKFNSGMTICYEGLFPEIGLDLTRGGAEIFINSTNDSWFGVSIEPYVHLSNYQMRAVESGRAYIRAANSGISSWIDSVGYIHDATRLNEAEVSFFSAGIYSSVNMYAVMGDFLVRICSCIVLVSCLILFVKVRFFF